MLQKAVYKPFMDAVIKNSTFRPKRLRWRNEFSQFIKQVPARIYGENPNLFQNCADLSARVNCVFYFIISIIYITFGFQLSTFFIKNIHFFLYNCFNFCRISSLFIRRNTCKSGLNRLAQFSVFCNRFKKTL